MIIFKVAADRFYREYQHWIQQNQNRYVEWYVDSDSNIHMYVLSNQGVGYYFSSNTKRLPELLKPLVTKNGEVFSLYESPKVEEKTGMFASIKKNLGILNHDK